MLLAKKDNHCLLADQAARKSEEGLLEGVLHLVVKPPLAEQEAIVLGKVFLVGEDDERPAIDPDELVNGIVGVLSESGRAGLRFGRSIAAGGLFVSGL